MNFFDFSFWQDFVSNALATFFGAIVGIPIAIWLSKHQEKIAEKERKRKILNLLRGELFENYTILSGWQKADVQKKIGIFIQQDQFSKMSLGRLFQMVVNLNG